MAFKNIFLVLVIFLLTSAFSEAKAEIDCEVSNKGCLLNRGSDELIIFFRGWVSPGDMRNYRGERKRLREDFYLPASENLIHGAGLSLGSIDTDLSIFVLGSAHLSLSTDEMDQLLEKANASKLIFASHSGGYVGMRSTILPAPLDYWEKVSGIWLLDNFYSTSFGNDLKRNFGEDFLKENCFGFVTDHNLSNYRGSYRSFCPKVLVNRVEHSEGVNVCIPYFSQGLECLAN